jgi:hypothetical protein
MKESTCGDFFSTGIGFKKLVRAEKTGSRRRVQLRDDGAADSSRSSETDPEARLYRNSSSGAVVPSYLGHAIMENRNGKESTWALAPAGFVSPVKAFLVL